MGLDDEIDLLRHDALGEHVTQLRVRRPCVQLFVLVVVDADDRGIRTSASQHVVREVRGEGHGAHVLAGTAWNMGEFYLLLKDTIVEMYVQG